MGQTQPPSHSQISLYHKEKAWRDNHLDDAWQNEITLELIRTVNPSKRKRAGSDNGRWSYQ